MLQVCMFGSYEGRLRANKRIFFTLFGGCTLRRPTLARRMMTERNQRQGERPVPRRHVMITLFGATEIKAPTLIEEFLDLQEGLRSGALSVESWDQFAAELALTEDETTMSVTLFGGFEEAALPAEDEEVDALALQRHLGNISDSAVQVLQLGVGQDEAHRRAVLRQAAAATA
ncbi:MAG: hypothetical protein GY778_08615 [bacterium]|nr:hypothetical protein [bacterium]